jgi:hypothetical protein
MTKKKYNRPEDSWLNGVEAALRRAGLKAKQEAERLGTPYVVADNKDSVADKEVLNKAVTLRDAKEK